MCSIWPAHANGFLHTKGKQIVNGEEENVILRGIGTGNWMLMEGYMMKTEGVAGTQHEIRQRLEDIIGVEKTDTFFNTWLENHFTRRDVDSMRAWGFNSVRVAMHYKWFTPPIEEEPVRGEITWLDKGFVMMDSLLQWCGDNEMYLIFDLHGAPGGQGKNADISDYDPSKPSLWESDLNKDKTVALWRKLAERYAMEPWVGGYDLINETNWTFPEGNNSQMRDLFERITDTIRAVDQNHIIYIEGNSFANDHSGLTPPWDDNLVYSFHKYWDSTDPNSLDWIIQLRDRYNVPLWLGESGENSNAWFTNIIQLSESKNIGWSWWPVKKNAINNVLHAPLNQDYLNLVNYWRDPENVPRPSEEEAFEAVMQWADNHKLENCRVQYDVIDAMTRQPFTEKTLPYNEHQLTQPIFFTEFDLGRNHIAYYDMVADNSTGEYRTWNNGWEMRNDGVDIELCSDNEITNGYNVGWTEPGEWMQYSLKSDSGAIYSCKIRHASAGTGSIFHFEVDGVNVSGSLSLPGTGDWGNWQTTSFENIVIPGGDIQIKFVLESGSSNLNYFLFDNPRSIDELDFKHLSAETSESGYEILLTLNKEIDTPDQGFNVSDFELLVNNSPLPIDSIAVSKTSKSVLVLRINKGLYSDQNIALSYHGNSVLSGSENLQPFSNEPVLKKMAISKRIPGKIQAEDFYINNGFELENCLDDGNGLNTSFAASGDFLVYKVHVTRTGYYRAIYRVATLRSNAIIKFQVGQLDDFQNRDTVFFKATGGWQNWDTQHSEVYLEEGYYYIRLFVQQSEHNLNWFQLNYTGTPVTNVTETTPIHMYPNPANEQLFIDLSNSNIRKTRVDIYDLAGNLILSKLPTGSLLRVPIRELKPGIYVVNVRNEEGVESLKLIVN